MSRKKPRNPGTLEDLGFTGEPTPRRRHGFFAISSFLISILLVGGLLGGLFVMPALATGAVFRAANKTWNNITIPDLLDDPLPQRSVILAADGSVIATFYAENRVPVTSEEIPDVVREAVIATEDARFYTHNGVDWIGTTRAALGHLQGQAEAGGGSGITQQYVKNLLVTHAKTEEERDAATATTLNRKLTEARAATLLETQLSKDEILTGYLNTVYFGDGAYGIGAAAQHFFGKTPRELTVAEAALLAGLVQNPTALNPVDNKSAALARRSHVLNRMVAEGYLTQEEAATARNEKLGLNITSVANGCTTSKYPMYCQWVRQILATDPVFGKTKEQRQRFLYTGGLVIKTALDPKVQKAATMAAREALPARGSVATALATIEPGTGHVVAIATNRPWGQKAGQTELLLPVMNSFQQGSTFKPYTAATAIEKGYAPDNRFYVGGTYIPANRNYPPTGFHNDGNAGGGNYDMVEALRYSVNTWFVALEDKIGVIDTAETAARMGLTSLPLEGKGAITEKDASLTLGTFETSPLLVANSYATIAAHGRGCNPVGIVSITKVTGETVPAPPADCRQRIRASTADTLAEMLEGVIYSSGGTGYRAKLPDNRPAGGKTGTTNDFAAAWFAGFTPQYATAVWIGDPRGGFEHPLHYVTGYGITYEPVWGGTIPALIWRNVMSSIHEDLPILPLGPSGGDTYVGAPLVVPDVRGLTPEQAYRTLEDAGFTVKLKNNGTPVPGIDPDRVTATTPQAGTILDPSDPRTITIKVYTG